MQKVFKSGVVDRIIDANINRAKEGLRVCEEVVRFVLDNRSLTKNFKDIRHRVDLALKLFPKKPAFIKMRRSLSDVGKNLYAKELKRNGIGSIFMANIQRAKESMRVLEEFSKLKSINAAIKFKNIRYDIYELEKKVTEKISPLCHHR
ncbi:MAG: hypothetical protein A2166_00140 [Omnitrophica WOR_2 bacterium RBG_13_41_10]|nr:MAG: hypothetical protein A2166_00140 [Omnitrophica WOR_2 bacterium RBG_13_41_10]